VSVTAARRDEETRGGGDGIRKLCYFAWMQLLRFNCAKSRVRLRRYQQVTDVVGQFDEKKIAEMK